MPKPTERIYSKTTLEALRLLGQLIRAGRIERRMTAEALAGRAGISRALLHRIEHGDPACTIGAAFEAAAIVGVALFEPPLDNGSPTGMARHTYALDTSTRLALLPKKVKAKSREVKDDF